MKRLNQREYDRIPVRLKLDIFGNEQVFTAETVDLSASGLKVKTFRELNEGQRFSLSIRSQLANLPTIRGEVVRAEDNLAEPSRTVAFRFDRPHHYVTDIGKLEYRLAGGEL